MRDETVTGKAQDGALMGLIEEVLKSTATWQLTGQCLNVVRVHERSISVAFPDGRVVSLVLYGPMGK
jgi:hypothetical protein